MEKESKYSVKQVTNREKVLLQNESGVEFIEESIPDGAMGEPATFTIMVTASAISLLAAYLLRKHKGESFEEEIREELPDGTIRFKKVKWKKSKSEAPKTDIIKQILRPFSIFRDESE